MNAPIKKFVDITSIAEELALAIGYKYLAKSVSVEQCLLEQCNSPCLLERILRSISVLGLALYNIHGNIFLVNLKRRRDRCDQDSNA
jgi:hypothetical protein